MTTERAIRKVLREHGEIQLDELVYLVGREEHEVRNALDGLGEKVEFDRYSDWVSLSEQPERSPAGKRAARGYTPESLRYEAEQSARKAAKMPAVVAFREGALDGQLMDDPAAWIEQREADPPHTGGALEYLRPGGAYVARVGTTAGDALDELRVLSETLADRFDWAPALASTFVLTDWTPPPRIGRRTWKQRITPDGEQRPTMLHERFADEDADAYAKAHRAARKDMGVVRRPADADMYAALVELVEQMRPSATWDEVLIAWNERYRDERPDWAYSRGDKLASAYKRRTAA